MNKKKFIFIISFLLYNSILYFIFSYQIIKDWIINWHISMLNYLYIFLDLVPEIINNTLVVNKVFLFMIFECTGFPIYILFTAAILSYPTKKKNKFNGLLVGLPLLFLLNIFRLVSVGLFAAYFPDILHFFHKVIWSSSYFIFFIFWWIIWLKVINKNEQVI